MRRVCSWCNSEMDPIPSSLVDPRGITHGICEDCSRRLIRPESHTIQEFLEKLPFPVMVVDDDVVVLAANKLALTLLGKSEYEVVDKLGGVVVECAYSEQPGGCGKTSFCRGCQLRESVTRTYISGRSLKGIEATLTTMMDDTLVDVMHHITTEKMGDLVLVRLDDLKSNLP